MAVLAKAGICYAAPADAINGYWDSGTVAFTLVAGRFAGSRAMQHSTASSIYLVKSSGQNDAVHHLVFATMMTGAPSASTNVTQYISLCDGATAQCTVGVRQDGALAFTQAGLGGAGLAVYTGAITTANVWYAFECEIVIHPTAGSFTVRKNGNTTADFTATSLNTRQTANSYANRINVAQGLAPTTGNNVMDDLFWQSSAATGTWLGDLRCYTRMPVSDQSVQFSRTPTTQTQVVTTAGASSAIGANLAFAPGFTASFSGPVVGGTVAIAANVTGHIKFALYDATKTLMATSVELVNPTSGSVPFTFPTPPVLVKGQTYYLASDQDVSVTYNYQNFLGGIANSTVTYSGFPPGNISAWSTSGSVNVPGMSLTYQPYNANLVGEAQQDATTSYVYDSTPGDQDFYGIAAIASTPVSTIAVTTRGYMQKSDAGTRTAAVQLKSGSTTVASPTLTLTTSGWQWAWRTDVTDPATSAAWTATAVNNAQIGPKTVA